MNRNCLILRSHSIAYWLILSFFLVSGSVKSQNITGVIFDAKTFHPLSDCLVIIKGTTTSTVSGPNGEFSFPSSIQNKTAVLVFTTLGYNTIEYSLDKHKKDTFYIHPKEIQLREIEIAAEKKTLLNPGSEEKILDFDFLNEHLIILVPGKSFNILKLLNERGEFISGLKVNRDSDKLLHDCLGNLQLLSMDSAWQIFYDYEKLNTLNPYTRSNYENILGNCICSCNNNFYFQKMEYRNLRTSYYYFCEKEKGIRHDLASFGDTAKIRRFELDYDLHYFLDVRRKSNYSMYNEPVDSIKVKMQKYREELSLDWVYTNWLGQIETQLLKNDTSLYLINFTDSAIYSIKNDNPHFISKLRADTKGLIAKIYTDEDYNDNYLLRFMNNKLIVSLLDIENGKAISEEEIPAVPYLPDKIIIKEGKVFYIQKNLADQQAYKLIKYYLK
ncbi:MAG: CarboxypepD reg-like domain [Bacteroidetes bacterium]|jgi:hypothetical protein|nr:CarboxypepD reg-like domain [Bacteroidota bacterium]